MRAPKISIVLCHRPMDKWTQDIGESVMSNLWGVREEMRKKRNRLPVSSVTRSLVPWQFVQDKKIESIKKRAGFWRVARSLVPWQLASASSSLQALAVYACFNRDFRLASQPAVKHFSTNCDDWLQRQDLRENQRGTRQTYVFVQKEKKSIFLLGFVLVSYRNLV